MWNYRTQRTLGLLGLAFGLHASGCSDSPELGIGAGDAASVGDDGGTGGDDGIGEIDPRCNDSCRFASDGVCDDGRTGDLAICDLGTDCSDCGRLGGGGNDLDAGLPGLDVEGVACDTDAVCGRTRVTTLSSCNPRFECAQEGEQEVLIETPRCNLLTRSCEVESRREVQTCAIPSDGSPCGDGTGVCIATVCQPAAACTTVLDCGEVPEPARSECSPVDPMQVCSIEGSQTETRVSWICEAGRCEALTEVIPLDCELPGTDGRSCGDAGAICAMGVCGPPPECSASSPCVVPQEERTTCEFAAPCDIEGVQEVTSYRAECVSGACVVTPTVSSEPCSRASRDGTPCGERSLCVGTVCQAFECLTTSDCPTPVAEPYGECDWTDICDTSSTRTRQVSSFRCEARTCVPQSATESEPCPARRTDGIEVTAGDWGECAGFSDTCDTTGTQSRTISVCRAGRATTETRTQPCSRNTDGTVVSTGGEGTCAGFANSCDETGTQTRTDSVCRGGIARNEAVSVPCERDTDGTVVSTGPPGTCGGFTDSCDQDGSYTRTNQVCRSGVARGESESVSCTRTTDGIIVSRGAPGLCGGFSDDCAEEGTATRINTVCRDGSPVPEEVPESCRRDTDGTVVSTGSPGLCEGFSDECDLTGTETRIDQVCRGGAISERTQTASCERDSTDGLACGGGGYCEAGRCERFTITVSPSIGGFTTTSVCDGARSRGIYEGAAVSVNATGNTATMEFRKCDGTNPSRTLSTWVVVGDATTTDSTICRASSCTRATQSWSSSRNRLTVSNIQIWPSLSALISAPCGDRKYLYIVTDGSDSVGSRTWYQPRSVMFTKTCL